MSGHLTHSMANQLEAIFVPSIETGEKMGFGERIEEGFKLAMGTGLDFFYGLSSILAKTGERFETGSGNIKFSSEMLRPSVLFRLLRGFFRAKINKRNVLPKDIWKLKGIMSGGTDTDIYRERIKRYWGREPLEGFGCTEGGNMAMQAWNYKGMTFNPDCNFLEFITYEDHIRNKQDPKYQPPTVLLNELQPGIYELVFTNLLGGVITRYRIGDLFEVLSLRDEELNIDFPQLRFYSRADDIIDLGGFTRLTERTIWQMIEASKLNYVEWTARKEEVGGEPILHLYIELSESDGSSSEQLKPLIRTSLQQINSDFTDLEYMLGSDHLEVTRLANNSFKRYMEDRQRAGADLAHVKPPHMQPTNDVINRLLQTEPG
jgi:phenylacetate-coenzyme A ligase PaaK-like adenylate-forming protein